MNADQIANAALELRLRLGRLLHQHPDIDARTREDIEKASVQLAEITDLFTVLAVRGL
jgi:hypothetical protein